MVRRKPLFFPVIFLNVFDFTRFETELFPEWCAQFKSGEPIGEYSYAKGGPTSLYGSTDMLISKYIINDLKLTEYDKDSWAQSINKFQNPKSGWYRKHYTLHYKEHTSAYAVAALHLIDRKPQHSQKWKEGIISSRRKMIKWINGPYWSMIWPGSHAISGVPAALAMTGEGNDDFFEWYFNWLNRKVDTLSGFWRRGIIHKFRGNKVTMQDMAGAFHMYYVYEFLERKWSYPEKIVDYTLNLQHVNGLWDKDVTYCVDLDGIYCLTRSSRNAGNYRAESVKKAIILYLKTAEKIFNDKVLFFQSYGNSHRLAGALAAIAECQKFYPDLVKTTRPWKQSLDKACFI